MAETMIPLFLRRPPVRPDRPVRQRSAHRPAHRRVVRTLNPAAGKYARAIHQATLLGESKEDHAAAIRLIDHTLAADGTPTAAQHFTLLVLRAEMAHQTGSDPAPWLAQAHAIPLTDSDRHQLADLLHRAADLAAGCQDQVR